MFTWAMPRSVDQIQRWQHQAEEYRTLAEGARNEDARASYLRLASGADLLADRLAETQAAARESKDPRIRMLLVRAPRDRRRS